MMYRPSRSSKSEWQIPTARDLMSTSSGPIGGGSRSATIARSGASKTNAFISSSLSDDEWSVQLQLTHRQAPLHMSISVQSRTPAGSDGKAILGAVVDGRTSTRL